MSAPFTQNEQLLILSAVGVLVLVALRSAWRAVFSSNGGSVRLMPLVVLFLALSVLFVILTILLATPFFVRNFQWMLLLPMVSCLLIIPASKYDEARAPAPPVPSPSRVDRFRERLAEKLKPRDAFPPGQSGPLINHLKDLACLFLGIQKLRIISAFNYESARARILQLKDGGEIWFREKPPGKFTVTSTLVRGNILPLFTGTLVEHDGRAVLEGRIEMDFGVVVILGIFSLLLLVILPLHSLFTPDLPVADRGSGFLFMFVWWGMLEWCYHVNKNSPAIIIKNLERALHG